MTRLAAVPGVPPRAVVYLRQSVSRDDSISLDLQEQACRDYCAGRGYDVVAVEADPGVSGRTWRRPAVQRVMGLVDAGDVDVVVLWKWSRLSRSRRDWAVAVDRVEAAGGRLESATEQVDVTTSTGRLARGMLAELAAFESERIGDVWREVHAHRVAAGLPPTGKPKAGYAYDREAKVHVPDPVTGPLLAECYARYVAGESVYALARWLRDQGARTTQGGPWSDRTLRRVMDAGFAAGWVTYRGQRTRGVHEPLIDCDVFAAYEAARRLRRGAGRTERSQYLLSGLVRCSCGSSMQAGLHGHARQPKYRCRAARDLGRHPGGYVMAAFVERAVVEWLRGVAADVDDAAASAVAAQATSARRRSDAARLTREAAAADRALVELTKQLAAGVVPQSVYEQARDELTTARDAAAARAQAELDRDRRAAGAPRQLAGDLLARWDVLPVAHRRDMLRQLIARVVVTPGRPRASIEIVPAWVGGIGSWSPS